MDKVFKEFLNRGEEPLVNRLDNGEMCWEYQYKEHKYTYYFTPDSDFYYLLVTNSEGVVEEAVYIKSSETHYIQD